MKGLNPECRSSAIPQVLLAELICLVAAYLRVWGIAGKGFGEEAPEGHIVMPGRQIVRLCCLSCLCPEGALGIDCLFLSPT